MYINQMSYPLQKPTGDFPGGPVVKILPSNARVAGVIPDGGAKISHTSGRKNQNIKKEREGEKQYCNKFNKEVKKSTIRLCKLRQTCCMSDLHNTTTYVLLSPVLQMRRPRLSKISSVQLLSRSDSLQPHGLQYTGLTCPSPMPRAYSDSYPLSR